MRRFSLLLTITKKKIYSVYFLVTVFSIIIFQMSFSSNDDNEVRAILDGTRFGQPDFHIPWISPLITYPISKLYEFAPEFYWYEFFLYALCIISHLLVLRTLIKISSQSSKVFQFLLFMSIFVLQFKSLNSVSYTNTSITVLGASIALMITFLNRARGMNLRDIVGFLSILVLFGIGFALRPYTSVGVLIFLFPSILYCFVRQFRILQLTLAAVSMSLIVWLINVVDKVTYAESGWEEWRKFTKAMAWPGDSNLFMSTLKDSFSSMSSGEFNLWLSANFIDPSQFTSRFLSDLADMNLKFDLTLFLQNSIFVSKQYGLYLIIALCLSLILRANSQNIVSKKFTSDLIKKAMYSNIAIFQCLYGISFMFLLAFYAKSVDRVFIGLLLNLIVFVVLLEPENCKLLKNSFRLDLFAGIALLSLSLVVSQTIDMRPSLGKILGGSQALGGYQKAEVAALAYIAQLPQCNERILVSQSCVLFLHTNNYPPFEQIPESKVRRLYLFWSAFSPKWKEVVGSTGAKDSLDLLCSKKGFLLNSKQSVGFVENYIQEKRNVALKSVPLSSLSLETDPEFEEIFLTLGSSNLGCSQHGSS
jgi:hypothetical protein